MAIHDWAEEHRPREKLLQHGAGMLSDAEIIAILLRTGQKGRSALEIASGLLARHDGLAGLARLDARQLTETPGLGPAKTAFWLASLELGRRLLRAELTQRDLFTDTVTVRRYLTGRLRDQVREQFMVLYLNQANRLIADDVLSQGTVDQTAVYPRELAKRALELNASAIIVAHNHPAGGTRPSEADLQLTQRLQRALQTLEIRLLDHIIIAGAHSISLRETTSLFRGFEN